MTVKRYTEIFISMSQTVAVLIFSGYYTLEAAVLWCLPRRFRRHDITGKVTLITGGGSGIGRLLAVKMAEKGSKIVVWDINSEGNEETAKQIRAIGGTCHTYTVDICDRFAVYKTAENVRKDAGKVDILVNNAGIVSGKSFMELKDEMIVKTFEVNTISHFWTTKAFLPEMMKENSGHIVTISSLAGKIGANRLVDYAATKFAAVGFDESLRLELIVDGYNGIFTTCVCPYYINTGMFAGVQSRLVPILEPEYVADEIMDAILMRKREIILPNILAFLVALKGVFPIKSTVDLGKALGGTSSMNRFVGRTRDN